MSPTGESLYNVLEVGIGEGGSLCPMGNRQDPDGHRWTQMDTDVDVYTRVGAGDRKGQTEDHSDLNTGVIAT